MTDTTPDQSPRKPVRKDAAAQAPAADKVTSIAVYQALKGIQPNQAMETIMTKNKEQIEKLTTEAAAAGKDHFDAWMKSGSIMMKGYEDLMKTCMGIAQDTAEKNGEAFKTLLGCKNVNEFTEVQTRLAQQSFDDMMTNATKLSEITVKLATDGFAPINDQLSKSIKKASAAMAA